MPEQLGSGPAASSGVSVIVSTYNRAHYIAECIESILVQSVPPSQVLVVDDGSTDGTAAVLADFGDNVQILSQDNQGKAAALNHALPLASGQYIWIFDDDDVALEDAIALRLGVLERRPEIDFVYSGYLAGVDGHDGRIVPGRAHIPELAEGKALHLNLMKGCFITQQGVLARASIYGRTGPFDVSYVRGQDYEMLLRMARVGTGLGLAEPTFVFRRHDGDRGSAKAQHASRDRDRVWRKYENLIGRQLREQVSLAEYLMRSPGDDPRDCQERRTALLQRMAVMSGKGLVDEMMSDLATAIQIDPRLPLTDDQKRLCRSAATREFFQVGVREDPAAFVAGCRVLGRHEAARDALVALARGLFWVARNDAHRLGFTLTLGLSATLMALAATQRVGFR